MGKRTVQENPKPNMKPTASVPRLSKYTDISIEDAIGQKNTKTECLLEMEKITAQTVMGTKKINLRNLFTVLVFDLICLPHRRDF